MATRSEGGTSCTLEVLSASSITMSSLAFSSDGFSSCRSSMALIPSGVAALPSPNTFASRLRLMLARAG